ncbi:hypothetical protein DSUL_90068 [Desulfovibrionales bacterium]
MYLRYKVAFFFAVLFICFGLIELLSYIYYKINTEQLHAAGIKAFLATDTTLTPAILNHDELLGWKIQNKTLFGERPPAQSWPTSLLAAFGDSFTFGDEVDDTETWEEHLAGLVSRNVFNFGNNAYGPDQAYLRFLSDWPKVHTPIATLGLISENIARVVNVYRRFYLTRAFTSTKPRFELINGTLVFLPNPIPNPKDLFQLKDPTFLDRLGQHDHWYKDRHQPEPSFPYSLLLVDQRFWIETFNQYVNWKLWDDLATRELLLAILGRFCDEARRMGTTPLLFVFPTKYDLQYAYMYKKPPPFADHVRQVATKQGALYFDGITALVAQATASGERRTLKALHRQFHLSPKGNLCLAEALFEFLRRERPDLLLPLPVTRGLERK